MRLPSWLARRLPSRLTAGRAGAPLGKARAGKGSPTPPEQLEQEERLNKMLSTYPANQAFSLRRGSLVPGRKLARRLRSLLRLYPAHTDSLLDIGCAQGFFVFDAARRHPDARVVGVDASDSYQGVWPEVANWLSLPNVRFYRGLLHEFVQNLEGFGGPFQVVLMVNTYHYLYFGSGMHAFGYRDHAGIFRMLRRLCTGRLIWSSPLENEDCPRYSERGDAGADYTQDCILAAARTYFTVEKAGSSGRRPVYLMYPRPDAV